MTLPFVGVDGEGGDLPSGEDFVHHQYTMLRAGDRYTIGPASPQHWLTFLLQQPKRHIYASYFFDYDVTMILRTLPETVLRPLVSGQEVYWGNFRLSYRPRKEFVVRGFGRRVVINDVGTFFQCRFDLALEQWAVSTPERITRIRLGKEARASFAELTPETIEYNRQECEDLAELMEKFRRTCQVIGYLPALWQGPGQLAKAMFRKHQIPRTDHLPEPPPGVWEMAQAAYYGGRFETSAVGPVQGPVEGWDINSAYPHAATLLPCLLHSHWRVARRGEGLHDFALYRVRFTHPSGRIWYGLPIRTPSGAIRWPRSGEGWYWGIELSSAQRLGARLSIDNGWRLVKNCDCRPFDFMHRLYSIRKGVGKTQAGIAIKLAMNSAYGITAQSVGQAPFANPVWAGLFTAITRARINDALSLDPYGVYMVATDGIYTRGDYPLREVDGLGGWERTVFPDGMFIVQPGVYFAGDKEPKTRGVPLTAIVRDREPLTAAWAGHPDDGHTVHLRQFVGLRLGLHRNALDTLGEWLPVSKTISYDWSTKRRPNILRRGVAASRTEPYEGGDLTVPYSRHIGANLIRDMGRLEFADTPEWAEVLTEHL